MANLVNELGYDVRTGKRDPRYKPYYVQFLDHNGYDSDVFYAKDEIEARNKCRKRNPLASIEYVELQED